MKTKQLTLASLAIVSALLLSACDGDNGQDGIDGLPGSPVQTERQVQMALTVRTAPMVQMVKMPTPRFH